jgi:hypothetical protein
MKNVGVPAAAALLGALAIFREGPCMQSIRVYDTDDADCHGIVGDGHRQEEYTQLSR